MGNPRYTDDLSKLDRVYDRKRIINRETVMIVVGNRIPAELLDRPVAESLRNEIDRRGGPDHPFRRAIVLTDTGYGAESDVALNPVISIGSHRANDLSKKFQEEPEVTRFTVSGRDGCYGLFQMNPISLPQVALWGEDAQTTGEAVNLYVKNERGLDEFLKLVWK